MSWFRRKHREPDNDFEEMLTELQAIQWAEEADWVATHQVKDGLMIRTDKTEEWEERQRPNREPRPDDE